MPDPRCRRCGTRDPEAFTSSTSAYCLTCWAWLTDHGRKFHEWCGETIARVRDRGRNWTPFR
jgi:hypothetical protein